MHFAKVGYQAFAKLGYEVRFEVLDDDGGGKVEHLGSCVLSIEQVSTNTYANSIKSYNKVEVNQR